jgi:uncharacterized protein
MFARPLIDSIDFARNGRKICGEVQMAALSRLRDMLSIDSGVLTYTVVGAQEGDRSILLLTLKGECTLRCQRCLEDFIYPFDLTSRFQLVTDEELAKLDGDDSIDGIEAEPQLDVLALVEDEVLLSLPFAPKHLDDTCSALTKNLQQSANPFAMLAGLKMKQ